MKKIQLLLLGLVTTFLLTTIKAQTYRYVYEYQYPESIKLDQFNKENMVLDINPDETKFYGYYKVITDSLNKKTGSRSNSWDNTLPALKWKKGSFTNINYELIDFDLFSYETTDEIKWNITNEMKKVGDYTLRKATTDFGGRIWEAWYNPDIPFFEGPYKFRGLDGLIFEVEDSEKLFKFSLVKSHHLPKTYDTTAFLEEYYGKRALEVKEKDIIHKKKEFYNDPMRNFIREYKETPKSSDAKFYVLGTEIKDASQFKELTEKLKKYIRESNVSIEKNKAIIYQ